MRYLLFFPRLKSAGVRQQQEASQIGSGSVAAACANAFSQRRIPRQEAKDEAAKQLSPISSAKALPSAGALA